jgi:L-ascorbate metabolism protein UlaG (beta-lactamase superfamily)
MKRVVVGRCAAVVLAWAVSGCGLDKTVRMAGPAPQPIKAQKPALAPGQLAVTWLGVAGALVRGPTKTVAFDPYVSRHNLGRHLFGNLRPDTDAIDRFIPSKVDAVFIGHAHADHVVDAPYLVTRDGADLVGSFSATQIARGYGAPRERLHVVGPGELVDIRGMAVTATRTGHVTLLGRVPGAGSATLVKPQPLRGSDFKTGGPRFWRVTVDGVRIGHLSTAKLGKEPLPDLPVDILLLSVAQMKKEDRVLERLLPVTRPRFVIPIHHDVFFLDLETEPRPMPGFNEDDLLLDVSTAWPAARVVMPKPMQEMVLDVKTGKVSR